MKIILKTAGQERRVPVAPGSELDIAEDQAQSLIARGLARAVLTAEHAPPAGGPPAGPMILSEEEIEDWVALNRDAALAAIEKIPAEQTRILQALLDVEQRNKKRVSVLEAIGVKLFPPVTD